MSLAIFIRMWSSAKFQHDILTQNTVTNLLNMEKTSRRSYKYCTVPFCKSTTKTTPDKYFFPFPKDLRMRRNWIRAMRRRDEVSALSTVYCCEDHFDLQEDTENYMKYKIMSLQQGNKVSLRLIKGTVPHRFQCQNYNLLVRKRRKQRTKFIQETIDSVTPLDNSVTRVDSVTPEYSVSKTIMEKINTFSPYHFLVNNEKFSDYECYSETNWSHSLYEDSDGHLKNVKCNSVLMPIEIEPEIVLDLP